MLPEEIGTTEQSAATGDPCPHWMCGSNSPEIENHGISGLYGDPQRATPSGFRLVAGRKNGISYRMSVKGGEFIASPPTGTDLSGTQVVGIWMRVTNDELPGIEFDIRIKSADEKLTYFAKVNGYHPSLWSYELEWSQVPTTGGGITYNFKNICTSPAAGESTMGQETFMAVAFEGDIIDAKSKAVVGFDQDYFNIGCAGHTLAKLHLTGHTHAASYDGFATTRDERTTMIKMLSADYCGTGRAFTVAGVKLMWADDKDWMNYATTRRGVEARWTAKGASCLDTPRHTANPTEASQQQFADRIEEMIRTECALLGKKRPPSCKYAEPQHLESSNPTLLTF